MASSITYKSAEESRDDVLRTIRNGLISRGVANPDVGDGSDYFLQASALGTELESLRAAAVANAESNMDDSATGEDLDRRLALRGMTRRPAGPSNGPIILTASTTTLVVTGAQLKSTSGVTLYVTVGGSYANGATIPVQTLSTGLNTRLTAGTVLRWVSPPAYAASTATVGLGGITGGVDTEDDETARARLLDRLANPPGGANASQVAGWAETVPEVQKAFPYPGCNGPSTCHVALVGYASVSTSRTRVITDAGLASASAAVIGEMPEFAEVVTTKTVDVPADVSLGVVIPKAVGGSSTGGGWLDAIPWPAAQTVSTTITGGFCNVSTVTSTTAITVQSLTLPSTASGFSIAWVSPSDFKLYAAKVLSWTSTGVGPYAVSLVLDTPFVGITTGCAIWPGAVNAQSYVTSVLGSFAGLGPGEKTSAPGLLPRALRRPYTYASWPSALGAQFLRALVESSTEVLDASWITPTTAPVPALPTLITDGPKVWTPRHIGIYPEVGS